MHQWAYQVESLQKIKEKKLYFNPRMVETSGVFIHSKDLT